MTDLDLAGWATILGTWVLVIGTLAFAYWQLRQAQRLHSSTTVLDLRERYYGLRMRQARRELSQWLLQSPRGPEPDNWEVGIFFELMGHLTRTRVLEKRMVWNAFGTWIVAYYLLITQPVNILEGWRREGKDPLIFREFEWLAKQMMEVERVAVPGGGTSTTLEEARGILEAETHVEVRFAGD